MHRIRELLLTQYIGAIVIGLVISQAITNFVSTILIPAGWYLESRNASRSVLGSPRPFMWDRFVVNLIAVALYVLIAYLLVRWLYLTEENQGHAEGIDESAADA